MKYLFLIILLVAILFSCDFPKGKPQLPVWQTELNLPIAKREIMIDTLLNYIKYLSLDSTKTKIEFKYTIEKAYSLKEFFDKLKININYNKEFIDTFPHNYPINDVRFYFLAPYPDSLEVQPWHYLIKSGNIHIENISPLNKFDNVTITPANFKKYNVPLVFPINTSPLDLSFAGSEFDYENNDELLNNISLCIQGNLLSAFDKLLVKGNLKDLNLVYFEGKLGTKSLGPYNYLTDFNIGDKAKGIDTNISIDNADLSINIMYKRLDSIKSEFKYINNTFNIRIDSLRINALNNSESMLFNFDTATNDFHKPFSSNKKILFDTNNSSIVDLVNFHPKKLDIDFSFTVNSDTIYPEKMFGSVHETDSIIMMGIFHINSRFCIDSFTYNSEIELKFLDDSDDVNKTKEKENIDSAWLNIWIENNIALEGSVLLKLVDINLKLIRLDSMQIVAPTLNEAGYVQEPSMNKKQIILDSAEVHELFDSKKILLEWRLSTPKNKDGTRRYVSFLPTDDFKINSFVKLKYKIQID